MSATVVLLLLLLLLLLFFFLFVFMAQNDNRPNEEKYRKKNINPLAPDKHSGFPFFSLSLSLSLSIYTQTHKQHTYLKDVCLFVCFVY